MTTTPTAPTDADLLETASSLVGEAVRDQLWLLPLDEAGVPVPVVIPIEGVPFDPDAMPRLAAAVHEMARGSDWAALVTVWERPGPPRLSRREAATVAAFAGALELPVRAAFLSSDDGVRRLPAPSTG